MAGHDQHMKDDILDSGVLVLGRKAREYRQLLDAARRYFVHDAETGQIIDVSETVLVMYGLERRR